jgi:hypothetical protein
MNLMRWLRQQKTAIAIILGLVALIVAGIWFWGVLVDYVNPGTRGATNRKDVVQAFALILAGVVGLIGGVVGVANLSVSHRGLQQQFAIESHRSDEARRIQEDSSQNAALQAYFEQMGRLLTDHNLISTEREDIRQLAQAYTLTVLEIVMGPQKRTVIRFLLGPTARSMKTGSG